MLKIAQKHNILYMYILYSVWDIRMLTIVALDVRGSVPWVYMYSV